MNTRHMSRWITACVSVVAIIIAVLYVEPAQADDTEDTGSITITYQYKNSAVQDAIFYLYCVTDWNESSSETPLSQMVTEDFRTAYPNVTWTLLDSQHAEEWRQLTTTLFLNMKQDGFDHVSAVATGTTDASGIVTFPGLSDGVYLAISPLGAPPQAVYSAQLISLPVNSDTEQDSRQVSVAAKPTPWNGTDTTGTVVETADTVSNNTVRPALTGTDIALIALIAVCALVLGVILIMEIRNARKQSLDD